MTGMTRSPPVPGIRLVSIKPLFAATLIAFNVFYLRRFHPGFVSGKLSDLGINFFLPVLLFSISEWVKFGLCLARRRRFTPLGRRTALVSTGVSVAYFVCLKIMPAFTGWHIALLRVLAVPFPMNTNFRNLTDPTDLVTLAVAPLAFAYLVHVDPSYDRTGQRLGEHPGGQ
jgi:hypothetical protein